jgi:hypothetical protein
VRRITLTVLTVCAAALVAGGCGQFGKTYQGTPSGSSGASSKQKISKLPFDAAAMKAGGCTVVETLKDYGHQHDPAAGGALIPQHYADNPPASGTHYPVPLDWGIYTTPQPDEKWVHNLEHGHIVILYKGVSKSDVASMVKLINRDDHHLVLIPRPKDPKNGWYFMAWMHRQYCAKLSAPALQAFVNQYRDQGRELFMKDQKKQS